jgi:Cft2 family RNA processing exonuclease
MKVRSKSKQKEHKLEFFKKANFKFKDKAFSLTLLPAGHILGSAMLLIEVEGSSILYSGDFKLHSHYASEKCVPQKAEFLIMETTFGKPEYKFPPIKEVSKEIISFCKATLLEKMTPVLLVIRLGKARMCVNTCNENCQFLWHTQVHKLTRIYTEFGYKFPIMKYFHGRK